MSAIETTSSPRVAGWTRLRARVEYERDGASAEEYWLDVPAEHASALATTGDAWLAWLAPLAVTLGEPLHVDAPADARFLANVREVVRVWAGWYPHLTASSIDARVHAEDQARGEHTGSFFTGGVDSFFTALRRQEDAESLDGGKIDALVFVWGFDIPLSNEQAWQTALASNVAAARELGVPVVPIVTNLRETRFALTDWTRLSHGAALAGVAHALGAGFRTVLIPSSASRRDLRPWGSHPETDPLFTSHRMRIIHDGVEWRRAEKTEYIARSPLALRYLRVCYDSADGKNCGRCKRCYRTMLALETLGVLEQCPAFERGALDLGRAERLYCMDDTDVKQFGFVRDLAVREGRSEIVRAIDRSFRRSSRMVRLVAFVRRLRDLPVVWRWAPDWERLLLRRWVV